VCGEELRAFGGRLTRRDARPALQAAHSTPQENARLWLVLRLLSVQCERAPSGSSCRAILFQGGSEGASSQGPALTQEWVLLKHWIPYQGDKNDGVERYRDHG